MAESHDTADARDPLAAILDRLDQLQAELAKPLPRFLAVAAAAVYASLSEDVIRSLYARGDLTALRPVKGRVLIDRLELDGLILGSTDRPQNGRGIRRGRKS